MAVRGEDDSNATLLWTSFSFLFITILSLYVSEVVDMRMLLTIPTQGG